MSGRALASVAEAPVLRFPAAIPLQASFREERIDGMDTNWLELTGQAFKARWFPGGDWQINSKIRGVSLAFVQRVDFNLQMLLSIYPVLPVLTNLEESSLLAYARSLPGQFPGKVLADPKLRFNQPPLGSLLFLDSDYRSVSYELRPANGVGESVHVYEWIAVLEDGRFARLRFLGTERFIRAIGSDPASELRRFMLDL
jgi:hypothetical protein